MTSMLLISLSQPMEKSIFSGCSLTYVWIWDFMVTGHTHTMGRPLQETSFSLMMRLSVHLFLNNSYS